MEKGSLTARRSELSVSLVLLTEEGTAAASVKRRKEWQATGGRGPKLARLFGVVGLMAKLKRMSNDKNEDPPWVVRSSRERNSVPQFPC